MKEKNKKFESEYMAIGTSLGMSFGIMLGKMLFDDMLIGMGIGMCLGTSIGSVIGSSKDKKLMSEKKDSGETLSADETVYGGNADED